MPSIVILCPAGCGGVRNDQQQGGETQSSHRRVVGFGPRKDRTLGVTLEPELERSGSFELGGSSRPRCTCFFSGCLLFLWLGAEEPVEGRLLWAVGC